MPTAGDEKKRWLRKIVGDVLEKIVPDTTKHIILFSGQQKFKGNPTS
jgi:hypothetical protein